MHSDTILTLNEAVHQLQRLLIRQGEFFCCMRKRFDYTQEFAVELQRASRRCALLLDAPTRANFSRSCSMQKEILARFEEKNIRECSGDRQQCITMMQSVLNALEVTFRSLHDASDNP